MVPSASNLLPWLEVGLFLISCARIAPAAQIPKIISSLFFMCVCVLIITDDDQGQRSKAIFNEASSTSADAPLTHQILRNLMPCTKIKEINRIAATTTNWA